MEYSDWLQNGKKNWHTNFFSNMAARSGILVRNHEIITFSLEIDNQKLKFQHLTVYFDYYESLSSMINVHMLRSL